MSDSSSKAAESAAPYTFTLEAASAPDGVRKGVLLIHGLTGAPEEMRYLARQLHAKGYTVHVPLMAGHGSSGEALLKTTWRDWLASMVEAYDRLAAEVDEVYAAGICLGGLLGVALAQRRPAMKGLAVYSVTFVHDGWSMPKRYRTGPFLQHVFALPWVRKLDMPEAPPFGVKNETLRKWIADSPNVGVEGALDVFPLGALSEQYAVADYVLKHGKAMTTPTLILHAVEDDQATPKNAERLRDALGGPVRLDWLNNSYHLIHVDQQRSEVARRTREFFDAIHAGEVPTGTADKPAVAA